MYDMVTLFRRDINLNLNYIIIMRLFLKYKNEPSRKKAKLFDWTFANKKETNKKGKRP